MYLKRSLKKVSSLRDSKLKPLVQFNTLINTFFRLSTVKMLEKGQKMLPKRSDCPSISSSILKARKNSLKQQHNKHDPPSNYRQNSNDNKKPPSKKQIQKLIFHPQILINHLMTLIIKQLSIKSQKTNQPTIQHLTKTLYIIRTFLYLTLKLDPLLSTINEALFVLDYKIDIIKQIMDNQFRLIELLQEQLAQALQNNQTQKVCLIIISQIFVLTKILQTAPHNKPFNWEKFWMVIKTWKNRFQYFWECFPFGVASVSFKKTQPYLVLIGKNVNELSKKSPEIKYYMELLIDQLLELKSFASQSQNSKRGYKDDFRNLEQDQYTKIEDLLTVYKKELDNFHETKLSEPQYSQNNNIFPFSLNKTDYTQTVIERQQISKLQVNYRYVQYGVTLYYSSKYNKRQKVDMLNDIREYIYGQYRVYEDQEQVRKDQIQEMIKSGKMTLLFVNPNLSKEPLVAYDFRQYSSANLVYTWLIYRIQETEQLLKK